jgi:hypothetical protein
MRNRHVTRCGAVVALALALAGLGAGAFVAPASALEIRVEPRCLSVGFSIHPRPSIELNPHVEQCNVLE